MKKNLAIVLIFLALASCKNGSDTKEKNKPDLLFTKVVEDFYSWYINENYGKSHGFSSIPQVIKINDSTFRLDGDNHIKKLKATGFFTDRFIDEEKKLIATCNKSIIANKWIADQEPDDYFDDCDIMLYDRWVGGQGENIDGFNITKTIIDPRAEKYSVVTEILIGNSKFTTAVVSLQHIDDATYKIDNISLQLD